MSHVWTNRITVVAPHSTILAIRTCLFDGACLAFARIMKPPWGSTGPACSSSIFETLSLSTLFLTESGEALPIARALSERHPDSIVMLDYCSEDSSVVGGYLIRDAVVEHTQDRVAVGFDLPAADTPWHQQDDRRGDRQ